MRARHRLSELLLRHGLVFAGAAWTQAHDRWLGQLRFNPRISV
jgi:transposase